MDILIFIVIFSLIGFLVIGKAFTLALDTENYIRYGKKRSEAILLAIKKNR